MSAVRLVCPSRTWAVVEDGRGLASVRCRDKFCRIDGSPVIHLFDLATGELRTLPDYLSNAGEHPAEEPHHGLGSGNRRTSLQH